MRFKKSLVASAMLIIAGCSTAVEHREPPEGISSKPQNSSSGWQPYKAKAEPRAVHPSTEVSGWRGNSAWKHPPAAVTPADNFAVDDAEAESVSSLEDKSSSYSNVAGDNALWIDRYVPAPVRERFFFAAKEASRRGSAVFIDEESGMHFEMSRVWKAGRCSGIEVTLLSKGGILPVVSRGTTEVCS